MTAAKSGAAGLGGPRGAGGKQSKANRATVAPKAPAGVCEELPRPVALPVVHEGIPAALRNADRWVCWRYDPPTKPGAKWRKVPCEPLGGTNCDATRPDAAYPFADCWRAYAVGDFDGIGFVLGPGAGGYFGGIDEDDCRDADGKLTAHAQAVSDEFRGSYAEVSPSSMGWKGMMLLDAERVGHVGKKVGGEELYSESRFFCITGHRLPDHAAEVTDQTDAFLAMRTRLRARNGTKRDAAAHPPADPGEHFLRFHVPGVSLAQAADWLHSCDPDAEEPTWFGWMLGWALQFGWAGFDVFDDWSSLGAERYESSAAVREKYEHAMGMNAALSLESKPVTVLSLRRDALEARGEEQMEMTTPAEPTRFRLETGTEIMATETANDSPVLGALLPVGIVMFAGQGGTGKSTILATAAAHVNSGLPLVPWESPGTRRAPAGVLWLTVEEDMRGIVVPRHEHVGGNLDHLYQPKIERRQDERGQWHAIDFDIEEDLPGLLAEGKARGSPIRLVVCDSLPGLVQWGKSRTTTSDTDVKKMLGRLGNIAREYDCCIAGIAHWNKKSDLDEAYRMSGAQAWRDTPRVSFTVERGYVYVNKANDLPEIGCTFQQEVVAVLRQIEAVTEDGKPIQIAARRAAFGSHLLEKAALLDLKKVDAVGDPSVPKPKRSRIDRLCDETREALDMLGAPTPVPSGDVWRAVADAYSNPNGDEKLKVCARLGLRLDKSARPPVLRSIE